MNNNSNNCGDCGTTCSECGRPWAICKQDGGCGCNKCKDIKFCEYGRMANGCIREKQPGCPMQAVIPSVTVESIEGIKNLADCLVHVSDINTTFYIDDKHRPIITWAGPIDIPGYDMKSNPNNYRDQIVTDVANQMAVIYDKSGKGYMFGLAENIDLQEQVNNKLDEMAKDGILQEIVASYLNSAVVWGFDTVADMKSATNLTSGSYARTLGYYALNDGGGAVYKISNTGTADEMFTIAAGSLYADLVYTNEIETLQLGIKNDSSEDISSKLNAVIGNTKISKLVFTKGSYTVNDTINIDRKIELDLNGSTITYTKENDALFDISTKYSIKPTIKNGYIIGTDTNTCFNLVRYNESTPGWGCSVNLYNLDVRRFLKVIYALNIFNCEITDCTFSTNGTYEIGVSDNSLMSNANCFKNCYFKAIDTQASYPSYSFVLSKVVNMSFIGCSFEQMNNVISNTSCNAIKFYNCEFEQISGAIAKNKAGMILDDSNHLIGISSVFEDVDYRYVPKNTYTSNFIYSDDNAVGTLRYKIRNAINKIRECNTLISTADGNNSVPDVRLQQDKWEIHKPLNILRNDSTEAGTTLTTNAYTIFAGQQNESHILTIYNVIYGNGGDRQIWRSTWMEINNGNFVDLETATCIKENVSSGSALNGNTLTETLNQNKYVATTSKQYATLTTIIKYEHLGNKIR